MKKVILFAEGLGCQSFDKVHAERLLKRKNTHWREVEEKEEEETPTDENANDNATANVNGNTGSKRKGAKGKKG